MKATKRSATVARPDDRCDLCGERIGLGFIQRWHHLRSDHRLYARGMLLRLLTPLAFIAAVGALSLAKAPTWTYIAVLACCGLVAAGGAPQARSERRQARSPTNLRAMALLRGGALRIVLLGGGMVALLIISRH